MSKYNGGRPKDPQDFARDLLEDLGRRSQRLGPILGVVLLLLIAGAGFYQVGPGEVAVIRTLGKETGRAGPGLHFRVPFVQRKDVVNTSQIRRLEVGFRGDQPIPDEAQMLTGDANIVEAQLIVQYRVADPSKYLFRLANPDDTMLASAEVAVRAVIGRTSIDDAITTGRGRIQAETRELLQQLMDTYQSGLSVTEVKLQSVGPPAEVKDSFHEVVRAREEKEQLINQAMGYSEDVIPRARGEAEKQLREAEAYQEQRLLRAQGDAKRFSQVYDEYVKARDVTRKRLYLETMERVLKRTTDKTVVDVRLPGSTLPVLQLGPKAVATAAVGVSP
jgi:modulator of FtsH protease HflK